MSTRVAPTVLDVARSVARLSTYAYADRPGQLVKVDGQEWTVDGMRRSVANCLAFTVAPAVRLSRVTRRDVGLMLAASGADPMTIHLHSRAIAAMLRADIASHRIGGEL